MTPNGPELWNAILAEMPAGAVIAGGAVRDYLLGVDPKDIDVFMGEETYPNDAPLDLQGLTCASARPSYLYRIDNTYERQEEYAAVSNIVLVSSGTMFGVKVDAIVVQDFDAKTLVEGFDFGITRCWYDGARIHDTRWAQRDRDRRTVTMLLPPRGERSHARFQRFNERMGGFYRLEMAA